MEFRGREKDTQDRTQVHIRRILLGCSFLSGEPQLALGRIPVKHNMVRLKARACPAVRLLHMCQTRLVPCISPGAEPPGPVIRDMPAPCLSGMTSRCVLEARSNSRQEPHVDNMGTSTDFGASVSEKAYGGLN